MKSNARELTLAECSLLIERYRYEPTTGRCFWKTAPRHRPSYLGREAGYARTFREKHGTYVRHLLTVGRKAVFRSRVAFLLMTGEIPPIVDHINGDSADDRWENLRAATPAQNSWNVAHKIKPNGLPRGVRITTSGKFEARISVHCKTISLGSFETLAAAENAVIAARLKLHGEFMRGAS